MATPVLLNFKLINWRVNRYYTFQGYTLVSVLAVICGKFIF